MEDKMSNMQEQINKFEAKINDRYPDLKIGHSYDAEEDYYHIWHTNSHLQFEDDDFPGFVGGLIKECFYSNDIYNFSFGYDYIEDEKSKIFYEMNTSHNDITFRFTEMLDTANINLYKMAESPNSFSLAAPDNINIAFYSSVSFNQLIRQADLLIEPLENLGDQIEKALAA